MSFSAWFQKAGRLKGCVSLLSPLPFHSFLNPVVDSVFFPDAVISISDSQTVDHVLLEIRSPGLGDLPPAPLAFISSPLCCFLPPPLALNCQAARFPSAHTAFTSSRLEALHAPLVADDSPCQAAVPGVLKKCLHPCNHHYNKNRDYLHFSKELPRVSSQVIPSPTRQPRGCLVSASQSFMKTTVQHSVHMRPFVSSSFAELGGSSSLSGVVYLFFAEQQSARWAGHRRPSSRAPGGGQPWAAVNTAAVGILQAFTYLG